MKLALLTLLVLLFVSNDASAAKPSLTVSYCDLFATDKYKGMTIITKAFIVIGGSNRAQVDGGEKFLFSARCNNRDFFALVDLSTTKPSRLLREFDLVSSGVHPKLFEIEIEGRLSFGPLPLYGHLDSFRSKLVVMAIRSATEVAESSVFPDFDKPAPIIEAAVSVKTVNSELLLWLFARNALGNRPVDISPRNTKWRLNGTDTTEPVLLKLFEGNNLGKVTVKTESVSQERRVWIVNGTVELETPHRGLHLVLFSNMFLLDRNQNWKLLKFILTS